MLIAPDMAGSIATGIVGQAFLVASGVVVARALGPENRGVLALVFVLSAIAAQVGSLGVPLSITYWVAAKKATPRALLQSLSGFRKLQLGAILLFQACLILGVFAPRSPAGFLWVAFLSLIATASALSQSYGLAVLQGLARFTAFNVLRAASGALYAIGVVVLWALDRATLTSVTCTLIGSSVVAAIVTSLVVRRSYTVSVDEPVSQRRLVSFGLRSLLGSSPPVETFRLDQLAVGLALSSSSLGYYVVALAFTNLTRFIGQSIGMVTFPRVAAATDPRTRSGIVKRDFLLGVVINGVVTALLIGLVPTFLPLLFGASFEQAREPAQILIFAAFLSSIRRILVDGTRGSGWPVWGTGAELLTLAALPGIAIASWHTTSLAVVAIVVAGCNALALAVLVPALFNLGLSRVLLDYSRRRTHGRRAAPFAVMASFARAMRRGAVLAALLLASAGVGVGLVVWTGSLRWSVFGLVAVGTAFQIQTLRVRLGRLPLVGVVLAMVNLIAVLGALFYRTIADLAAVSADMPNDLEAYRRAAVVFAVGSVALWCGALAATIGAKRQFDIPAGGTIALPDALFRRRAVPLLMASTIPLAMGVIGLSVHGIISRPYYLEAYGPVVMVKLSSVLVPMGVVGAGLVVFKHRAGGAKTPGTLLLVAYTLYLFSEGSRMLALVPLLLLGAYLITRSDGRNCRKRPSAVWMLLVAATSLALLHLPLALRSDTSAGLAPYAARLLAKPTILFPSDPLAAVGNVLFSVPLTGYTATHGKPLPFSYFLTSVNPLPSSFTNWPAIQASLRINGNTPFSALGELALYGYGVLATYCAVVGFIAVRMQIAVMRWNGMRLLVGQIILGSALLLFSVSMLQYNLRSSSRILWYTAALMIGLRFIFGRRSRTTSGDFRGQDSRQRLGRPRYRAEAS